MTYCDKELMALYKRMDYFTEQIQKLEERRDEAEYFLKIYDKAMTDARKNLNEVNAEIDVLFASESENALVTANAFERIALNDSAITQ